MDHYECYDDFDRDVAREKEGDCFARYRVRIEEMRQSLKILRQACDMIPGGPTENLEAKRMAEGKNSEFAGFDYQYSQESRPHLQIPNGELYTRLESGKGEIGVFLQGNNDVTLGASRSAPLTPTTCRSFPTSSRDTRWPTSWRSWDRST